MKVFVTNIPLHAFASGIVEVPDDTREEDMQESIGKAVLDKGYKRVGSIESPEIDDGLVKGGWEFSFVGQP